jgi:outer membrane protein, heavy metal efflux system
MRHTDLFTTELTVSEASPALDTYIRTALRNNQMLHAAFDDWQAALEEIPQVTALPNPKFEWTHFVEEIQTRTGPQNNRFSISQDIPWKGKRAHGGIMMENRAEALWWHAAQAKLTIIRDVKSAYYEYAYLGQAIRIVGENIELLHNLEPIVQVRIRGGASQGDLLRLQNEIGLLENERESLKRLQPAINQQLSALLNDTTSQPKPFPNIQPKAPVTLNTLDLMAIFDKSNPELNQFKWHLKEAEHHVIHRELDRKPDFTVGITYIDTGSAKDAIAPSDSGDDPFGISVGISIPIWRKKIDAGIRQSRNHESAVRRTLNQKRQDLHAQLELEAYKLDDAVRQMELCRNTMIPRTRQVVEITQVEYESGNATLLDIIDSERELLIFEKNYWRAVSDYAIHLANLEAMCGGDLS